MFIESRNKLSLGDVSIPTSRCQTLPDTKLPIIDVCLKESIVNNNKNHKIQPLKVEVYVLKILPSYI
jgi:hypothetical protein